MPNRMDILIKSLKSLFSPGNEFIQLAKNGKRITHIALAIPLVIVFLFGGIIIAEGVVFQVLLKNPDIGPVFRELYNLVISFGLVLILVWIWVRYFEKRPIKTLGFTKRKFFRSYFEGFFTGMIMLTAVIVLMTLSGTIAFKENTELFTFDLIGIFVLMLIGYIVQGATEEILIRGWQFQVIAARYRPWLGAVVSSLMFAFLHGLNPGVSFLAVINLILFAFLLLFFILYYRNIWAACGWHTAWNWSMENIYGLKVSGSEGEYSMLNLTSFGPKLLTGGEFGPEGSIYTTMVLLSGILIILILESKKTK